MNDTLKHARERLNNEGGYNFDFGSTPGVPVLYHTTPHGNVIGVDSDTVCLYTAEARENAAEETISHDYQGEDEMMTIVQVFDETRITAV